MPEIVNEFTVIHFFYCSSTRVPARPAWAQGHAEETPLGRESFDESHLGGHTVKTRGRESNIATKLILAKSGHFANFTTMSTLVVHPVDTNQETAIRLFLDALHVDYNTSEKATDDTEYLSLSPAMTERLNKAAQQEKNGEGKSISLDDIWK